MPFAGGAANWPIETSAAIWLAMLLLKGAAILVVSEVVLRTAKHSSASVRHLIRASSLAALVLLPLLSLAGPQWELDLLPESPAAAHDAITLPNPSDSELALAGEEGSQEPVAPTGARADGRPADSIAAGDATTIAPAGKSFELAAVIAPGVPVGEAARLNAYWLLAAVWAAGAAILSLRLLLSFLCVRRAIRRAQPVEEGLWLDLAASAKSSLGLRRPASLVIGRDAEVALSVGLWRAVILLPEVARTWSLPRRRSILLHELAHVKRRDNLINLAGELACILHWPNPLVWLASRGLRVEREQACDDEVLAAGARPSEYAGHLLEFARAVAKRRFWGRLEISQSSALKDRFKALLDPRLKRYLPGPEGKLLAAVVATLMVFPLAALSPWKSVDAGATLETDSAPAPLARFVPESHPGNDRDETAAANPGSAAFTNSGSAPTFGVSQPALGQPGVPQRQAGAFPAQRADGPSDEAVAQHRAWPMTQLITSGGHLSPRALALWAEGPPHRIWGVQPSGETRRSAPQRPRYTANRLLSRDSSFAPAATRSTDSPGPIQPPPTQPALRVEVQRLELGTLGGVESKAADINESGMVVGQSKLESGLVHPFLWSADSGMVDLTPGLQVHSRALKINDSGRVLCETFNARFFRGYLWTLDAGAIDIGAFSGKFPFTIPSALNERGHVVGGSRDDSSTLRAFLWTPQEGMLDLGTPEWSEALAVNESDQVVGYTGAQAFLWDRTNGFRLIGPAGSSLSIATDINNRGQVVGYAEFGDAFPQAFIWNPETGAVPLGTVGPDFPISFALSIDERGHVLGRGVSAPREGVPNEVRLFRWTPATGIEDLGPIEEQDQLAINALGQIVASYSDGSDETEKSLARIWTEQGPITVDLDQGSTNTESEVTAVNNRGQLAGSSLTSTRERRATLWDIRVIRE